MRRLIALRRQTVNEEPATSFCLKQKIFFLIEQLTVDILIRVVENDVSLLLFLFDVDVLSMHNKNLELKLLHPASGTAVPIAHYFGHHYIARDSVIQCSFTCTEVRRLYK